MNAIVCGTRSGLGTMIERALTQFDQEHFALTHIYVGSFQGVDQEAFHWALRRERPVTVMPAEWREYGTLAGPIRNERMLMQAARAVLAFPGGKGTTSMITVAHRHHVPVWQCTYGDDGGFFWQRAVPFRGSIEADHE